MAAPNRGRWRGLGPAREDNGRPPYRGGARGRGGRGNYGYRGRGGFYAERGPGRQDEYNPNAIRRGGLHPAGRRGQGRHEQNANRRGSRHGGSEDPADAIPPTSYTALKEMAENDEIEGSQIILRLSSEHSGFSRRLRQDMDGGMIQMVLKVIGKMCREESPPDCYCAVLTTILKNRFTEKLVGFLHGLIKEGPKRRQFAPLHISNTLDLLKAWMERIPTTSENEASLLVTVVKHVVSALEVGLESNIAFRLDEISTILNELDKRYQPKEVVKDETFLQNQMHQEAPPNNFRDISIFPQIDDINGTDTPFVRTNLVGSAYSSTNHYLDVQFRLLREDFVRPLREGIRECFTLGGEMRLGRQTQHNVKVYESVTIEYPLPGRTGIQYCVHFNPFRLQRVKWETSRRLMFGNLVCLSADKFKEHFLFASIADRDPRQLMMGYVCLEFVNSGGRIGAELQQNVRELVNRRQRDGNLFSDDEELSSDSDTEEMEDQVRERLAEVSGNSLVSSQDMKRKYYMVETEAYFEAYRHVLSGLQKIQTIPMERYIVECRKDVKPARYIRTRTATVHYNFKSILKENDRPSIEGSAGDVTKVDILKDDKWPSAEKLQLDPSQVAALKNAITNELSVIQGPPGTGKTHVGLVIMKLLLDANNRDFRDVIRLPIIPVRAEARNKPSQILVVCYTNHALDQFLEGISEFHHDGQIIRVGGRCKTKSLEKYSLNHVRRYGGHSSGGLFHRKTVWEHRRDLQRKRDFITAHTQILDVSTHSIVRLNKLKSVIPPHMYAQLTDSYLKGDEAMLQWLGVTDPDAWLYDKPYIVTETINVIATRLQAWGYHRDHVVTAMVEKGYFDERSLMEWMDSNPRRFEPSLELPNPDYVFAYLETIEIPFDPAPLIQSGFHQIEIQCALLATDFAQPNVNHIKAWLQEKSEKTNNKDERSSETSEAATEEEAADTDAEEAAEDLASDFEKLNIQDDDVEFIRDQRNVDEGSDDKENANDDRQKNVEAMKKIEKELAAATFESIGSNMKCGGWQLPPQEIKRRKRMIKDNIGRVDAMPKTVAHNVVNIFHLNQKDRWKLYRRWMHDLRDSLREKIEAESLEYNRLAQALTAARNEEDLAVLRSATVIGMTTTGAAKYRDIVHRLPAKVVVVEEAAEVLEAHIVTSMPQTTEHLILIGDHQQLKPSPTVYELARKFNLDVSLFERMIKNGIPCSRLALQHRMRPRIADLLRPHIYEDLRDHESVLNYEDITGVQKNIFFLSHEHEEDNVEDGRSKVNQYEANFLVSLSQYLLQQGYLPEQITILTAYVGQLHVINRLMRANMRKIRVTAVDNFQGEENDIILLSLVRSNEEGKIGFLGIENRVCVALSRAKKGLFCVGNGTLLKEKSRLWRSILSKLERDGMSGDALPLQCKHHPGNIVMAKNVQDFQKVPEGGCGKPCQFRLPCGHVCTRSCHPDDGDHKLFQCRKPCEKFCKHNHKCKKLCSQKCVCTVRMMKTVEKCGHLQEMPCHQPPNEFCCNVPCTDILPCGHTCAGFCGKSCPKNCIVVVKSKELPCGHPPVNVPCFRSNAIRLSDCEVPCNATLKCGHKCKGSCYNCHQNRLHQRCREKCGRMLFCGHVCRENCSARCPPCQRKCETACVHSKCGKRCFEPCVLCKEKCPMKIDQHRKCSKLCSEPCDKQPADKPCKKKIKCGHQCIGLVGEPCPTLCRICDKETVTEIFFGNEAEPDSKFVQLECGHVFAHEDMDKWMEQESSDDSDALSIQLKECPRCKRVIRKSYRYQHIINKQLMLINEVKIKINGTPENIEGARKDLTAALERALSRRMSMIGLYKANIYTDYGTRLKILQKETEQAKTMNYLSVVERKFQNLQNIFKIKAKLEEVPIKTAVVDLIQDLNSDISTLLRWLSKPRPYFSDQEISDFDSEFSRLKQCLQLLEIKAKLSSQRFSVKIVTANDTELKKKIDKAHHLLFVQLVRYDIVQEETKSLMEEIKALCPSLVPGLGRTEEERDMIVKAMSFGKGHWNKCKNGHVYCIGNCGGPNQVGICPECKTQIGGTSHRLAEGNQLASEMDGATAPAYDPNNFFIPPEI